MSKTPIQQLIEWLKNPSNFPDRIDCLEKATKILEAEKQMVIDAYEDGFTEYETQIDVFGNRKHMSCDSKDYYNTKYLIK